MKEISQVTACVIDNGLFLPVAQRLAKDFKRVLYQYPQSITGFPTLSSCIIGDGYENIEQVEEFWPHIDEIDLFVFSDIGQSGLQLYLESIGKAVWGSRAGDTLETNREYFLETLKKVGLPVPDYKVITGLTKLRDYLEERDDLYIKISKYRGDMETWHWRDMEHDAGKLDSLAVKFGPCQNEIPFLVFTPIEAVVEDGGDTYGVDGQWPSLMLHGVEEKDRCYLGAVTPTNAMPADTQDIMEAFAPVLEKYRYRNEWSMETRNGVYIDPTCRGGLPSTGSQLNTWANFSEIIWAGANGILVEPDPLYQFSAECILSMKSPKNEWGRIVIPKKLEDNVKLAGCCEVDKAVCFPPDGHSNEDVGWLVAGGDTMEEAIEEMHRLASDLPEGLSAATDELVGLLSKIHAGEKEGIEFSDQNVPDPETALDL